MWWSRDLSKASVSRSVLAALEHQADTPPFRVLPSEDLDLLLVSDQTVVGIAIVLGRPACSLSYTVLAQLERASYLLATEYPHRRLSLTLLTNLQIPAHLRQVLDELGIHRFSMAENRFDAAAVTTLMRAVRVVPSAR